MFGPGCLCSGLKVVTVATPHTLNITFMDFSRWRLLWTPPLQVWQARKCSRTRNRVPKKMSFFRFSSPPLWRLSACWLGPSLSSTSKRWVYFHSLSHFYWQFYCLFYDKRVHENSSSGCEQGRAGLWKKKEPSHRAVDLAWVDLRQTEAKIGNCFYLRSTMIKILITRTFNSWYWYQCKICASATFENDVEEWTSSLLTGETLTGKNFSCLNL